MEELSKKVYKFEDLDVWKLAHKLTLEIYKVTTKFPSEEKFGLISQMRRSAFSVPTNIAEGSLRMTIGDYRNFISIARGSVGEIRYQLKLALDLTYISQKECDYFTKNYDIVGKMLTRLYQSLSKKYQR